MTNRATLYLMNDAIRQRAVKWIMISPKGTRVDFRSGDTRTEEQSRKMHAMLTDVSRQHLWHGARLNKDQWKLLFLDALGRELELVPNLAGDGFVPIGRSSRDLTIAEMSDMIELMYAWGANLAHPVRWTDPTHEPSAARERAQRQAAPSAA
jgi:NinB protein